MRSVPSDSFLSLDRNVAINVELFLHGNAERTQGEVKINVQVFMMSQTTVILHMNLAFSNHNSTLGLLF